jgi:hypothetical protein
VQGTARLVEGIHNDGEPEYVGVPVTAGQTVYVLVAGWVGDPGPYTLETILLPPGAPVFDVDTGPDLDAGWVANAPLRFTFNVDLDPDQDLTDRVVLIGDGRLAEGVWCAQGNELTFFPRLPVTPNDDGGLAPGQDHLLQFPRAARGVRAITGEYLSEIIGAAFLVAPPVDQQPGEPVRVVATTPAAGQPWNGGAIGVTFSRPIDPATFSVDFVQVLPGGTEIPLGAIATLKQTLACDGGPFGMQLTLPSPPAGGATVKLKLPGTIAPLGGTPSDGLAGPEPAAPATGFQLPLTKP